MSAPPRDPKSATSADESVERIRAWASRPTLDSTLDLLLWLREAPGVRAAHVDAIAKGVADRHAQSQRAMVGLGRLQMHVGKLPEAQQTLVAAGRIDATARAPYVYLGELMLKRGDLARAERMLERAAAMEPSNEEALAGDDDEVDAWLAEARAARAIAAAVKLPPLDAHGPDEKTLPRAVPLDAPMSDKKPIVVPPPMRPGSPQRIVTNDKPTTLGSLDDASPPPIRARAVAISVRDDDAERTDGDHGDEIETSDAPTLPRRSNTDFAGARSDPNLRSGAVEREISQPNVSTAIASTNDPTLVSHDSSQANARLNTGGNAIVNVVGRDAPAGASTVRLLDVEPDLAMQSSSRGNTRAIASAAPAIPSTPSASPGISIRALGDDPAHASNEPGAWNVERQLTVLEDAGIFERSGASASPTDWTLRSAASSLPRRGRWMWPVAAIVVVGAVAGTLVIGRAVKQAHADEAATLVDEARKTVESGSAEALGRVEVSLGRALELDSRSMEAARTWLRDRTLRSYLWPSDDRRDGGLASAMERGRAVGLSDDEMAYARVALSLTSEDTASAAKLARALDDSGKGKTADAWRELAIGWVLERAGDSRAFERYARALEIDGALVPARLSLAKGAALAGNAAKTTELLSALPSEWNALKQDLLALAAIVAQPAGRGSVGKLDAETRRPAGFSWIEYALRAAEPTLTGDARRAMFGRAIAAARDPLDLTRVGRIALALDDAETAGEAALRALAVSPIFAPARSLAARIALQRGRVDDAARALSGFEGSEAKADAEVAALRAWLAYEQGAQTSAVAAILDDPSLPSGDGVGLNAPDLRGIVLPLRALARATEPRDGTALQAIALLGEIGPVVAFDMAMDAGDTKSAAAISRSWGDAEGSPARAARLSRLARLSGKGAEADRLSKLAIEQPVIVPRALVERVLTLCGLGRAEEAVKLLARYPLIAGDEQPWLKAYALALSGKVDEAKRGLAPMTVPEAGAPWPVRRDALLALAASGDHARTKVLLKALKDERSGDPEIAAAERLR